MTADPVTVIAEALDEWQGFDAHPRRKTMAQVVADALLAAGLLPQGPGPTAAACPHGDVTCPCQDGDPCHYEPYPGSAAMPSPMCKAPHAAVLHAAEADYERVEMRPYHEDAVVPPSPVPPTTEQDGGYTDERVKHLIEVGAERPVGPDEGGDVSGKGPQKRLPSWADEWLDGTCGCGARLVLVYDYTGGRHTVCAKSGWETSKCQSK